MDILTQKTEELAAKIRQLDLSEGIGCFMDAACTAFKAYNLKGAVFSVISHQVDQGSHSERQASASSSTGINDTLSSFIGQIQL